MVGVLGFRALDLSCVNKILFMETVLINCSF